MCGMWEVNEKISKSTKLGCCVLCGLDVDVCVGGAVLLRNFPFVGKVRLTVLKDLESGRYVLSGQSATYTVRCELPLNHAQITREMN